MQTKRKPRGHRGQLLTLLNGWDPAGLLEAGGPRDEYEWCVDSFLDLLSRHASKENVAAFLEREIREHFGTVVPDACQFATKAVTWYEIASRDE